MPTLPAGKLRRLMALADRNGRLNMRAIGQRMSLAMRPYLQQEGKVNFPEANAAAERSRPWFEHRKYTGAAGLTVAGASPSWHIDS